MTLGLGSDRPVVGMVHLDALPGAPDFDGDRTAVREAMRRDARRLSAGGVDAVMVENFGDAPFYADSVPAHTVAEMSALVADLRDAVDIPVGVNVLRNDAEAAVSIAAATGASFVRVNVHTGVRATDQGLVTGRAAETVRLRERLDADVAILADVDVKHAAPIAERPLGEEVADLIERGKADGIVASGASTGRETDREHLEAVVGARDRLAPGTPVFVGSGTTRGTVADLLQVAEGAIVGSDLKQGGETTAPVDEERVRELVAAASH
ncbi:BtpA/SgcQ family protein [Halobellus ruber]|uniref:BtpA/SgcQ family protein n=1 Tax=Halobellus ruber TaxID=2761102 RepID=A0A7J9SND9_9EURY|nr:BtpA/SgcQ family protein [Halobellus ruber]MBB6647617.1 BtpA/SgcQ family protein [Halobellus ruber]